MAEADVVVHLAFMIMGGAQESRAVNLEGSRNVFEATVSAGARRLVYASSVAAYGFHRDNPQPLTEDVAARGTAAHYYSAQKAEVEALLADTLAGSATASYVFRPCIVAGPHAPLLIDSLPYTQISERLPSAVLGLLDLNQGRNEFRNRCCPILAFPFSSSTTTTSRARCAPRCSAAAGRACTTSPAPAS